MTDEQFEKLKTCLFIIWLTVIFMAILVITATRAHAQRIICLGDSVTEGYAPELMKMTTEYQVVNAGRGGFGMLSMASSSLWIMAASSGDIVLLEGGYNDMNAGGYANYIEGMNQIIKICEDRGLRLIFLTQGCMAPGWTQDMIELARKNDLEVIDFAAYFNDKPWYFQSGSVVHMTRPGYRAMAREAFCKISGWRFLE